MSTEGMAEETVSKGDATAVVNTSGKGGAGVLAVTGAMSTAVWQSLTFVTLAASGSPVAGGVVGDDEGTSTVYRYCMR